MEQEAMDYPDYESLLNEDGSLSFFPGFEPETQIKLEQFYTLLDSILSWVVDYDVILAYIGTALNIAYFVVLTRKSMMNNSINFILAVLAVNDLVIFSFIIYKHLSSFVMITTKTCTPPNNLLNSIFQLAEQTFRDLIRKNSCWLLTLMAGIRTLSISNVGSQRFAALTTLKFGIYSSILSFLGCIVVSSIVFIPFLFGKSLWNPEDDHEWRQTRTCEGYSPDNHITLHELNWTQEDIDNSAILDTITTNVVPCVCYPVLAIFLIRALLTAKKNRSRLGQENGTDRTTILIVVMTVTFLFAEIPQSIGIVMHVTSGVQFGFSLMGSTLTLVFLHVSYFNACIHCFICFALSSNYRTAVCEILRIKRNSRETAKVQDAMETTQVGEKTPSKPSV